MSYPTEGLKPVEIDDVRDALSWFAKEIEFIQANDPAAEVFQTSDFEYLAALALVNMHKQAEAAREEHEAWVETVRC